MVQSLTRRAILRIGAAKRHADPVRHGESRIMVRIANKGDLYVHQAERDQGGSVKNWNVTLDSPRRAKRDGRKVTADFVRCGVSRTGHHLVEHYEYSPYGELTVDQDTGYGDRDGDGKVDSTDKGTVGVTCTGTVSGACRILDLVLDTPLATKWHDRYAIGGIGRSVESRIDGDYDSNDATQFDSLAQGLQRRPGKQSTGVSQPFAHQGLLFEPEIASYQNRARQYNPAKRRFNRRDPLITVAGRGLSILNTYVYESTSPIGRIDPDGLWDFAPAKISITQDPDYASAVSTRISIATLLQPCASVKWINVITLEVKNDNITTKTNTVDWVPGWTWPWYGNVHQQAYSNAQGYHFTQYWFQDNPGVPGGMESISTLRQEFLTCAFCEQTCPKSYCTLGCWRWWHYYMGGGSHVWYPTINGLIEGGGVQSTDTTMLNAITFTAFMGGYTLFQPCDLAFFYVSPPP